MAPIFLSKRDLYRLVEQLCVLALQATDGDGLICPVRPSPDEVLAGVMTTIARATDREILLRE